MKVSDSQIREAMQAVRQQQLPVSGERVRAELKRRFGACAGTSRLYRIVTGAGGEPIADAALERERERNAELQQALANAIERAELAEFRERSHQEIWAREIDELRMKQRAEVEKTLRPGMVAERELALRRELLEAQQKIAFLEQRNARAT